MELVTYVPAMYHSEKSRQLETEHVHRYIHQGETISSGVVLVPRAGGVSRHTDPCPLRAFAGREMSRKRAPYRP